MSPQTATLTMPVVPAEVWADFAADSADLSDQLVVRTARADEALAIHALVEAHLDEGRLLPRTLAQLSTRTARFVVAVTSGAVVACAELAPLSATVAEVRSLVVGRDTRHRGVGRQLVDELVRRARVQGFETLSAFTHGPGYFVRMGFSLVPHHWMREKIAANCQSCALFRRCGQSAVVLSLSDTAPGGRPAPS